MKFSKYFITCVIFLCIKNFACPCTEFRLQATDKTVLITRTMEYDIDLRSNLRTSNRNRQFTVPSQDGKSGLSWRAKYGYIFFDGLNVDIAVDGMNEAGLSFGALYLPKLTAYQTVPKNQQKKSLPYIHVGDWILSNFSSVQEVKAALQKIYVYTARIPNLGDKIFPLHFSIYDSTGNGLVVEYINGQLTMYDNNVGVLTNSPSYEWHLANLNNYIHLSPENPKSVYLNDVKLAARGEGFGMLGLPGDSSPPSRFVKIATLLRVITSADDALGTVNLAAHVVNNVDIPRGLIQDASVHDPFTGKVALETTQWTAFKDLTHKMLYFHTYDNLQLNSVSLEKLDFSENAKRLKINLVGKQVVNDITSSFLNSH